MNELLILSHPEVNPRARQALLAAFDRDGWNVVEARPEQVRVCVHDGRVDVTVDGVDRHPDAVVGRTVARYLDLLAPAFGAWQDAGVVVLNGEWSRRMGRDKLATAVALAAAGVPTVDTVGLLPDVAALTGSGSAQAPAAPALPPGTGVLKPARGHSGHLVTRADDPQATADFWQELCGRATETAVEAAVAQPLIADDQGTFSDLRAYVVAGRVVGIMRRRPGAASEWRSNARLGAVCEPLPADHPGARLAARAAAALRLDAAGVDLIGPDDDLRVLEVDGWAGFEHLAAATGADVPGSISRYLRAAVDCAHADSGSPEGGPS